MTEPLVRPDTWFTLEAIATGARLSVRVDGRTTANIVDNNKTFTGGHFALQHSGPETVVQFRKIEIKELPAAK